jgi:tetratricopeptide (TPR) repeat protein
MTTTTYRHCSANRLRFAACLYAIVLFVLCCGCSKRESPVESSSSSAKNPAPQTVTQETSVASHKQKPQPKTAEAFVQEASQLLDNKNIEGGWQVIQSGLVQHPADPALLFLAARVLALQNKLPEAIAILDKIPADNPVAGFPALGQSAEWAVQLGDLRTAEKRLQRVLQIAPESPATATVRRILTKIYNSQGRRWEASKQVMELIRRGDFTEKELIMLVNLREPFDDPQVTKAAKAFNTQEPLTQLGEIRVLIFHTKFQEAVDRLRELATKEPQSVEAWVWTGVAIAGMEKFDDLENWHRQPPPGFDSHPEYWNVMGDWSNHQGQFETAARSYSECIRRDPRNIVAHQQLGECLARLGLVDDAEQVRLRAANLIEIASLVTKIVNRQADTKSMLQVADLYEQLQDPFLSVAWRAIAAFSNKQPLDAELLASLKGLKTMPEVTAHVLSKLPIDRWPLPESTQKTPAQPIDTSPIKSNQILMANLASELGIDFRFQHSGNIEKGFNIYEAMGGGVALLDYDRDGWCDVFFSQAGASPKSTGKFPPKQFFRSHNGAHFVRCSDQAFLADMGYGQGLAVSDFDQDGFRDIAIANFGSLRLYRNQGDGSFELAHDFPTLRNEEWNSSIALADVNGDSLPDILQCGYCLGPDYFDRTCPNPNFVAATCHPHNFPPCPNHIRLNSGDGSWSLADPLLEASIATGYTLGVLAGNIDQEFGNDVFYANDNSVNFLLQSEPNATGGWRLKENAARSGVAVSGTGRTQACMGIAMGDVDRNNQLDLIVTNFRYDVNTVYLQVKPRVFIDATKTSKMHTDSWDWLGFGCQLVDLDDDGWLDFAVMNGHIDDYRKLGDPFHMPTQVFQNNNGTFRWLKNSESPGPYFDGQHLGRGLAQGDLNRDGRMDLVATHLEEPAAVLINKTGTSNHFVELELVGVTCDRDAIGATVKIQCGQETWTFGQATGDGFYGSNEQLLHIGLGQANQIDEMQIQWPDGRTQQLQNIAPDQRLLIIQDLPPIPRPKKN